MIRYHCFDGVIRNVLREHLNEFHRVQQGVKRGPTAMEVVRRAGLTCVVGKRNAYFWRTRAVMLTPKVAHGTDPVSICIALHEVQHDRQPRWLVRLATALKPFEWWCELDCWRRLVGH